MTFDFTILSTAGLLIFLVYVCAGIVDAVCGGGGMFTVPALMAMGLPPHMVVGTNQGSLIFGNITSMCKYVKNGKIDWKVAGIATPFAVIGALLGSKLNLLVSERYLQIIMLVLLPVIAVFTLLKKDIGNEDLSGQNSQKKMTTGAILIGFFVGTYHAFYGPGSGLFFMASFCVFLNFDVLKSNGITRVLLLVACIMSSVTYATSGNVLWKIVIVTMPAYVIGNYIGASLALKKGAKIVKPAFYFMLVVLFIKLISDYFL